MQKITPFLWFNDKAEEAANFYVSVFKHSKITDIARYGKAGEGASGMPEGTVMTVGFTLDGQEFTAINGGPIFTFSEAISFVIDCKDQEEVDYYWDKLVSGGEESQCGWLKDRYGLSWQVVPRAMGEMMSDKDPKKSERVMQAMLTMKKLDVERLKQAYEGK